jgi:hypothetical protein
MYGLLTCVCFVNFLLIKQIKYYFCKLLKNKYL